jgi:hypothetical protein
MDKYETGKRSNEILDRARDGEKEREGERGKKKDRERKAERGRERQG